MSDGQGLRVNPNIRRLVCSKSGREVDSGGFRRPIGLCACCPPPGKPVVVDYHLDRVERPSNGRGDGLWRWASLLPVLGPPRSFAADVGLTATVELPALGGPRGVVLLAKNEGVNPSGSFKDRGLAVGIAFGRACGAERFCLPTQGNAGVAASLFSARLGLPGCLVYMPEDYRDGIYNREARLFGAEVRFAGRNIAAAGRQMRSDIAAELASGALVDLSTFFEPGRLEGKKTMGLELFDHFGAADLPEWILYPTGGGTGLVGIWKAFRELAGMGLIDLARHRLPRMVAVQAANCAPVVRSFERGLDEVEPVESAGTVADGLDVPGAIMGHGMLAVLQESNGTAVAVAEEEIVACFAELGRAGVTAGFESAALVAALDRLLASGTVRRGSRVLLLLTSSHLVPLGQRHVPGW